MPTIQELQQKYSDVPAGFEEQLKLATPEEQRLIRADMARTGNTAPSLSPSFQVREPMPTAQPAAPMVDMAAILERLNSQPSPYADQMKEALANRARATEAFNTAIDAASKSEGEAAPSKAELYFRLAAAFGAPTKTGSFFESLGKAGETAADYNKETRQAAGSSRAKQLQLMLEKQKMALQGADTELTNLRSLASEESKDKRAVQTELFKQYLASGKPQSEAGKFAADQGFKPGTPEFAAAAQKYFDSKMESGDWYKQVMATVAAGNLNLQQTKAAADAESKKKLTPAEVKLRTETEDSLAAADSAMGALRKAFKLNPNTFDSSIVDTVQRKALELSGSKDPKVLATRELENLLGQQALSQMKSIFGAAPTEGERAILMSLQGIDSKSVAERELIMKNAYDTLARRKAQEKKRLDDILSGVYRDTRPIESE
jgi:hypothetical protein